MEEREVEMVGAEFQKFVRNTFLKKQWTTLLKISSPYILGVYEQNATKQQSSMTCNVYVHVPDGAGVLFLPGDAIKSGLLQVLLEFRIETELEWGHLVTLLVLLASDVLRKFTSLQ